MSNLTFAFDKPLTSGTTGTGGNFPKLGHAYKAEIVGASENEAGTMVYVEIKGLDYTDGKFNHSFAFSRNSKFIVEEIERLTKNVIASNESMSGAIGQMSASIDKWNGKGLQIGVVFKAKDEPNEAGQWAPGKWLTPDFSIPVDQVEEFEPKLAEYEAHRAKFWSDSDGGSAPVNTPVAPIEDESDLPF